MHSTMSSHFETIAHDRRSGRERGNPVHASGGGAAVPSKDHDGVTDAQAVVHQTASEKVPAAVEFACHLRDKHGAVNSLDIILMDCISRLPQLGEEQTPHSMDTVEVFVSYDP